MSIPEWREDILTGRRVLISPDRAERPIQEPGLCPFCEGTEEATPPEVYADRKPNTQPNGPGWRVRVIPNRYAAVRLDIVAPNLVDPAIGIAEVVLECPEHQTLFHHLSVDQIERVLRAWRERIRFWREDGRLGFVQVFKNQGVDAGASLEHCHSQVIGLPDVPSQVLREISKATVGGKCGFCDWLKQGRLEERIVARSERFTVVCPDAPRFPAETWILPNVHESGFEFTADESLHDLATHLLATLQRLTRAFGHPDYNLILKSAPFQGAEAYHWRLEILPRLVTTAGWEWGTGVLINTCFPETAAQRLRESTNPKI
jgi:UDPglucose--hexose-1-phosphate uridylyltransferase